MRTTFLSLILISLLLAACNMDPKIEDLRVCNKSDYSEACDKDVDVFDAAETDVIYFSAYLSYIPENTRLKITWYYMEDEEFEIDHVDLRTEQSAGRVPLYSYLSAPDNGWPTGKYKVTLDVDGFPEMDKKFSIE